MDAGVSGCTRVCLCVCVYSSAPSQNKDLSFTPLYFNLFKDLQHFSEVRMFFPLDSVIQCFVI